MAKRKPFASDSISSMDHQSYRIDDSTKEYWRSVVDEGAHELLEQIIDIINNEDTTTNIYNILIPIANSEYSLNLPLNTKQFLIKSRNHGHIKLAYSATETSTNYITIPKGNSFKDSNFYSNQTIYFQSNKINDVLEIITYS